MRDLDLFFKDKSNFVYITSGGGMLPSALVIEVAQNVTLSAAALNVPEIYEVAVTNRLEKIKHLDKAALDRYLASYVQMARRGFFSYDKTNLGNFDDRYFQLIVKSVIENNVSNVVSGFKSELTVFPLQLPAGFEPFDLFELYDSH